jgi:c-di-GMP-binding flagellar brake protein YcgR
MAEKRKFMRFEAVLDVIYSILGNSASKTKSYLKNLSKEGLGLIGNRPLQRGSFVELEMKIPGDNIPIFAFGEVAWANETGKSKYDAGIKFTKIKNQDRARLLDYVYAQWVKIKKENLKD